MTAHDVVARHLLQGREAIPPGDADAATAARLLDTLADIVASHGPVVATVLLTLTPIALVKGESREQLQEVLSRVSRGLPANAFLSIDLSNGRFPTTVVETGSVGLAQLSMSPNRPH